MGGGDFYDGRMLHEFAPEQRSPRHEPYAVFPAVCAQITLLIKRVQLDLVEYGETAERAPDFLQMFDEEMKRSSRCTPHVRIASPTSASFPYMAAESMYR